MARRAGRTSLGMLPGRLRGGFSASSMPRNPGSTGRSTCISESSAVARESPGVSLGPQSPVLLPPSRGGSSSPSVCSYNSDQSTLDVVNTTLQIVLESTRKLERKLSTFEQKQVQLTDQVKELTVLLKRQERNISV